MTKSPLCGPPLALASLLGSENQGLYAPAARYKVYKTLAINITAAVTSGGQHLAGRCMSHVFTAPITTFADT